MNFYYVIIEAIQALKANMLRSMLTIVGIVVGIFAVTAMLALGAGLTDNILSRFNSFSVGDITVNGQLTQADRQWVSEQRYTKASFGGQAYGETEVVVAQTAFYPRVEAALGDFTDIRSITLVSGELFDFTDPTYNEPVALIDQGLLNKAQTKAGVDITNGAIDINGQRFTVIGVMAGGTGGFDDDEDGSVIIPYAAALGVVSNTQLFNYVAIALNDTSYTEATARHLLAGLNLARNAAPDSLDHISISSSLSFIETAETITSSMSLFLGVVGGIALFVGGIGTMNMMLTTVTERTKEIGLRKAIGARNRDILIQILVESTALTVIGGAIGIALTYAASFFANSALASTGIISVSVNAQVVAMAAGVSLVVGIVFGLYPAYNAAKLQPVDALRSD